MSRSQPRLWSRPKRCWSSSSGSTPSGENHLRQVSGELSRAAIRDPRVTVVYQSHASFLRGLDLYERRADKGYNLVDCISMEVMRERGIIDVLSGDQHFRQRGSSR